MNVWGKAGVWEKSKEILQQQGRFWSLQGARVLWPAACMACGGRLLAGGVPSSLEARDFCEACWSRIRFAAVDAICVCPRCTAPLFASRDGKLMRCCTSSTAIDSLRYAVLYEDPVSAMLVALKNAGRMALIPVMARWLVYAGHDLWPCVDCIVPVPPRVGRLMHRGYCQVQALAQAVARNTGCRMDSRCFTFRAQWRSSQSQTRAQRMERVADDMALTIHGRQALQGLRVLILDDVTTTGATLEVMARRLREKAGASSVMALTVARRS